MKKPCGGSERHCETIRARHGSIVPVSVSYARLGHRLVALDSIEALRLFSRHNNQQDRDLPSFHPRSRSGNKGWMTSVYQRIDLPMTHRGRKRAVTWSSGFEVDPIASRLDGRKVQTRK